jgi:HEAT repeat protein
MRNAALALVLAAALPLAAQNLANAHVTPVRAAADLGSQIRAANGWIGYIVPAAQNFRGNECGYCSLDDSHGNWSIDSTRPAQARDTLILYRVEGGSVERIRVFSTACSIDGAGRDVTMIENVDPRVSVRFLETLIDNTHHEALAAIASHADESATDVLDRLAHSDRPAAFRGDALFWLGIARGHRGYEIVRSITTNPTEATAVKEKGVFAMMQSHQPEAVDDVLGIAKHDESSKVRGQALFWLAQAAGKKAAAALRDAIENDPDISVKEKAIFGISQLPDDQSIPMLADLMRNHHNPTIRKKAAFWLGQKNDPRAVAAIEDFLRH